MREIEHYTQRDIGELPMETNPETELRRHVMRDGLLGDHEKPEKIASLLSMTTEEMRQAAVSCDDAADEIAGHQGKPWVELRSREYARLLTDLAEEREKAPEAEIEPREAVDRARAIYQELLEKSKALQLGERSRLSILLRENENEGLKADIDEAEQKGFHPEVLVALLEKYPNLKETHKLGSLARNQYFTSKLARKRARSLSLMKPLGDERDERVQQSIKAEKELEQQTMEQYRMLKTAVKALKQGLTE